jgi:hypothetical protein
MTHPFALKGKSGGNSGAWNAVHSGDHVIYLITGQTGILDECLHDGDAFVSWDDGTFGTVKWYNLAPSSKVRVSGNNWEAMRDPI